MTEHATGEKEDEKPSSCPTKRQGKHQVLKQGGKREKGKKGNLPCLNMQRREEEGKNLLLYIFIINI
ncbi:MAG: hypothetical protein K5683_11580 [Prevotella sp.]|nr:hypothetical protein [Prevotella sp.]